MSDKKLIHDEILDSIAEGLITVNKDFNVDFYNRAAENITGYNREEALGKFCKHILKCDICQ